ncbi:MAG TPA: pyridoxamine 5'-phosphate oxidase family protein [Pyrinomonadaceae bacterium]|nr:pyridoxamine 5'-phosphate oxidase family protein [Pyrinomonadaceae bacterium]
MKNHSPFKTPVTTEAELQELIGEPSEVVKRKQLSALDQHCRTFISLSPFLLIATSDGHRECDVSPRGDAPGFVLVIDKHTLVIPERPGNRRVDSLRNILQSGSIGIVFMIPGVEEMLRVNGKAWVIRDESLLKKMTVRGKQPLLGIGVEIKECFLHCGKAVKRSQIWNHTARAESPNLPSLAVMLKDQVDLSDVSVKELEQRIEESYTKRLY